MRAICHKRGTLSPSFIEGDLNAKSTIWGSNSSNNIGHILKRTEGLLYLPERRFSYILAQLSTFCGPIPILLQHKHA